MNSKTLMTLPVDIYWRKGGSNGLDIMYAGGKSMETIVANGSELIK